MICPLPFLEQNTHLRVLIGFSGAGRRFVALAMCLSLSGIADQLWSEGRFVVAAGERARCRGTAPRIVLWLIGGRRTRSAAATAESAATAAAAARLVHLGGRIAQRWADLVHLELDDGAFLALTSLVRALLEPALNDHPRPASEAFGHVLGGLTPDAAPHEKRVAVFPLVALTVKDARRRRDREVGHGRTGRGEPKFRVGGQISDDGDDGVTSHGFLLGWFVGSSRKRSSPHCARSQSQASLRKHYDEHRPFG